jgi:murein L,D-transpeptidase YcbB/YkuD
MRRPRRRVGVPLLLALLASLTSLPARAAGQGPPVPEEGILLRINLPSYRLEVFRDGERVRSYPVAIGLPDYPTPQGAFPVSRVTWNPWWNPPARPWARGSERTPPGPGNPMGRAKIEFDSLYYLHGSREALERPASHGCIRLSNEDALDLARFLATEAGALAPEEIDLLEGSSGRTRSVGLPEGLARIEIVYRLTDQLDRRIVTWEDVYGRGLSSRDRRLRGR